MPKKTRRYSTLVREWEGLEGGEVGVVGDGRGKFSPVKRGERRGWV